MALKRKRGKLYLRDPVGVEAPAVDQVEGDHGVGEAAPGGDEGERAGVALDQRTVEPGGGSTIVALRTRTTVRSRMYCISGCEALTSRIAGLSTVLELA